MTKTYAATSPRRGPSMLLLGLVGGALLTLATPTAVLAGVLLLPSLVVTAFDRVEGKPLLRAVLLCGLAGAASPMLTLWTGGHSLEGALNALADTAVPATAWAAQAGGWLLAELMPLVIRFVLEQQSAARAARLRASRARLEAEWGIPPATEPGGVKT